MVTKLSKFLMGVVTILLFLSATVDKTYAQVDSVDIQYSLFSEYYKNKDYESALPYGFTVLRMNPDKFAKWIFDKMETTIWYLRDSTETTTPELKTALSDTMLFVYDLAMQHFPENKLHYQLQKSFITETWFDYPIDIPLAEYLKAVEIDSSISTYYYDRIGRLYARGMDENPDYKQKAIEVYSYLSEKEPNEPQWNTMLENLVENMDELIEVTKRAWDLDPENLAKGWKYANLCMKSEEYEKAVDALEQLVVISPDNTTYWNNLSKAYNKLGRDEDAMNVYKSLIELEPNNPEHHFNLGIFLAKKGQYSSARSEYQKAFDLNSDWGAPIFYEAQLYEKAAASCSDAFMQKVIYQLAVNTYRRAYSVDPELTQANERANQISAYTPTQEDYFFRKMKSGQTVKISGCADWIGRSITVP